MKVSQCKTMGASLAFCFAVCRVFAVTLVSTQDWQFPTGLNPTAPTVSSNLVGNGELAITLGYGSIGWVYSLEGMGSQTGIWDLGGQNPDDAVYDTRGRVGVTIPNVGSSEVSSHAELTVQVTQFVDGLLYDGSMSFSLTNAINGGRTIVENLPGALGGAWVQDTYRWHLAPSPEVISLVITGATWGNLVDRVIATVTNTVPVAPLVIDSVTKSNESIWISWSGGLPPYQLYTRTNLTENGGWVSAGTTTKKQFAVPARDGSAAIRVSGYN